MILSANDDCVPSHCDLYTVVNLAAVSDALTAARAARAEALAARIVISRLACSDAARATAADDFADRQAAFAASEALFAAIEALSAIADDLLSLAEELMPSSMASEALST